MRKTLKLKKKIKQIKGGSNNSNFRYVIGERMEDVIANPKELLENLFKIYTMPINPRFWKGVVKVGKFIVNTPISFSILKEPNVPPIYNNKIPLANQKNINSTYKSTNSSKNLFNQTSKRLIKYPNLIQKTRRK